MFRVQRADKCIWLLDERERHVEIHMVPEQAMSVGASLIAAAMHDGAKQFTERVIGEQSAPADVEVGPEPDADDEDEKANKRIDTDFEKSEISKGDDDEDDDEDDPDVEEDDDDADDVEA